MTTSTCNMIMYWLFQLFTTFICISYAQLQDCGGILRANELELKSPGYPGAVRPGVSCDWMVQSVSNKICKLEVEFIVADLYDSSLIIAGVPHSGSIVGLRTFPFNGITNISFRSGKSISKGFDIIVKQKSCNEAPTTCGSVLDSKDIVVNGPVSNSQNCTYVIKPSTPNICKVEIKFDNFVMSSSTDCVLGGLEIGDDILCGNVDGHRIYALNEELHIRYHTKHSSFNNRFSLIIKQRDCGVNHNSMRDKLEDFNVTEINNGKEPFLMSTPPFNVNNYGSCCNQIHYERHFYLASPGFPNSNNIECTYTLRRNNPHVQYLKMNFKYFWVGEKDDFYNSCNGGFLQIDGYTFCGCQTGVTWVTQFDYSEFKNLRLFINQAAPNRFTGFVIEVIQIQHVYPPLNRYKRQLNTINQHVTSNMEFEAENVNFMKQVKNKTVLNQYARYLSHTFIPTDLYCLSFNIKDWVVLLQQALWAQMHCPINSLPPNTKLSKLSVTQFSFNPSQFAGKYNCTDFKEEHGVIHIGETFKQNHQSEILCFRFQQTIGKCILEVIFHDVEIPWSVNCTTSNVHISGIGHLCPIAEDQKVQIPIRTEPVEIIVKNTEESARVFHFNYRKLSCT